MPVCQGTRRLDLRVARGRKICMNHTYYSYAPTQPSTDLRRNGSPTQPSCDAAVNKVLLQRPRLFYNKRRKAMLRRILSHLYDGAIRQVCAVRTEVKLPVRFCDLVSGDHTIIRSQEECSDSDGSQCGEQSAV